MRISLPLTIEHGRIRAALAALCAMAVVAALAAVAPSSAHAAFTLERCQGGEVTGEGSSLQKLAQADWKSKIFDNPLEEGCENAPVVNFKTASSGCGLDAMGAGVEASGCEFSIPSSEQAKWEKPGYRDGTVRFGAADFAPTPEQEKNIDDGPNGAGQPGSGEIHVIPVAGAAITAVVHFPDGCGLQEPGTGTAASGASSVNGDTSTGGVNDPTGAPTGDLFSNQTIRVHIPDQKLEEIWQGKITTWGEIVKETEFETTGMSKTQAECADTPIVRIVREDTSGTTYNFKHFLALLPFTTGGGPTLWTASSSEVGTKNTAWPLASGTGAPADVNSSNVCESAEHICHAAAGKGSSLALAVKDNSGSIGYLDLATAREEGFDMTPNETGAPGDLGFNEADNDHLYWIPLEAVEPPASEASEVGKVDSGVFVEPTAIAKAHFAKTPEGEKGANCEGAAWRNIPSAASSPNEDPTLGDWSKAIATGGTKKAIEKAPTTAYPVCAITYDLAFDDDASVYGDTSAEEAKARTVRDYLTSVVSPSGQLTKLTSFDYATLPLEIIHDAQTGVAAIGWDKSAGSGGGGGGGTVTPPVTVTPPITTPIVTPAVVVPSNAFSIASAKVKGKDVVLSLVLPDAGQLQIKATGGGVTVSNVTASVSQGQGTVTLPISSAALKKLAKAKSKKLTVSITVTFTPTGGTAATQSKTLTITQASIAGKPKKKSKKGKKKG